ncbi:hypothetical protein EVAR_18472_1 [Eumeta japonica]|uniref:Uncharacterized protein n=1 Tax=Eumeta variegata TaxID=151549 RepID=A0A4C1UZK4_EUMVA|nr:hypothetical protein EVAR_18472_1 [Eumeta japonica]
MDLEVIYIAASISEMAPPSARAASERSSRLRKRRPAAAPSSAICFATGKDYIKYVIPPFLRRVSGRKRGPTISFASSYDLLQAAHRRAAEHKTSAEYTLHFISLTARRFRRPSLHRRGRRAQKE